MNELVKNNQNAEICERTIDDVAREVIELTQQAQTMMVCYVIEIGRRLKEAKSMLSHGEWGNWLKTKVNYSQSTADNYMKIFEEYGAEQISFFGLAKSQTLGNLPYTKALKLLALPSDEREDFIKQNDVDSLSTRELDRLIEEKKKVEAERDEARERAEELEAEKIDLDKALEESKALNGKMKELEARFEKAEEERKKAKAQIKELKNNPHIPDDVMERLKNEANAEAQRDAEKKIDDLEKKTVERIEAETKAIQEELEKLRSEKAEAENRVSQSTLKMAELEKKIKMSSPEATTFKVQFETAQKALSSAYESLEKLISIDGELGERFKVAFKALIKRYEEI